MAMSDEEVEAQADAYGLEEEEVRRREQQKREAAKLAQDANEAAKNRNAADNQRQRDDFTDDINNRTTPQATAATVNPAAIVDPTKVDRTGLGPNNEFRTGQQGLISMLQDQAAGKGPSLGGSMIRRATDRNLANLMSQQAATRGGPGALAANRSLMGTMATANQDAAGQIADARFQEQIQAQQMLGNVLNSARTGDTTLRSQDIDMAKLDAQLEAARKSGNQQEINRLTALQAQMQQQTNMANPQLALQAEQQRDAIKAQLMAQGLSEQEADRQARLMAAQMAQDAWKASQGINEARRQSDTQDDVTFSDFLPSDEDSKFDIKPAGLKAEIGSFGKEHDDPEGAFLKNFGKGSLMNETSGKADLPNMGFKAATGRDIDWKGTGGSITPPFSKGSGDVPWSIPGLVLGGQRHAMSAIPGANASIDKAIAKTGMRGIDEQMAGLDKGLTSDERSKTGTKPASDMDRFLNALKAVTFNYKDAANDGPGRHIGVIAQDLERTEFGRSMVRDTPKGKVVDGPKLAGAAMAGVVEINRKLEQVLNRKGGKK